MCFHVTEAEAHDFAAGLLESEDRQRILRHLLSGCPACSQKLLLDLPELFLDDSSPLGGSATPDVYDGAIDRALASVRRHQARVEKEKKERELTLSVLRRSRGSGIANLCPSWTKSSSGRPLAEALCQLSFEARYSDPRQMLWLAHQARIVAEDTDPESYTPGIVSDLKAQAWAELANAHRVNEQFNEAELAFERAHEHLEEGSGDPSLLARVLSLKASLRRGQRRVSESFELLTQAYDLYLQLGERHLAGRVLVGRATIFYADGNPFESVRCLERAIAMLDQEHDPQLAVVAFQALAEALTESGDYRRAGELLLERGFRQAFASQPIGLLRLRWVEGKVHAGLGRLKRAERILRKVREGFLEQDLTYNAALVGLDLASVWLRQGKAEPVKILAEEMLATFESLEIRSEASKARLILKAARGSR